MTKTRETIALEEALKEQSRSKREYGCTEVTIGFHRDNHGDEIADYMSMDSTGTFRCYELKVSLADLASDNKLSWYGDYNYLVVSEPLYARNPAWGNYIPPYVGILSGTRLQVRRKAKKKEISEEQRNMLRDSLIRSLYWKMDLYSNADNLDEHKSLQKQLEEKQNELLEVQRAVERMTWTYNDYETWYRRNHQKPSFTIEQQAKLERAEYSLRSRQAYTWKMQDGHPVCPRCSTAAIDDQESAYCPHCGADLRSL